MSASRKRRLPGVLMVVALVTTVLAAPAHAGEPPGLQRVPAELGKGIQGRVTQDLPALGYTEEEYKLSGTATSYTAEGTLGTDGRWNAR